jgi:hypothetical protein
MESCSASATGICPPGIGTSVWSHTWRIVAPRGWPGTSADAESESLTSPGPTFRTKIATLWPGNGLAHTSTVAAAVWFCLSLCTGRDLKSVPGEPAYAWSMAIASRLVMIGQTYHAMMIVSQPAAIRTRLHGYERFTP